jgi:hypothetical protein
MGLVGTLGMLTTKSPIVAAQPSVEPCVRSPHRERLVGADAASADVQPAARRKAPVLGRGCEVGRLAQCHSARWPNPDAHIDRRVVDAIGDALDRGVGNDRAGAVELYDQRGDPVGLRLIDGALDEVDLDGVEIAVDLDDHHDAGAAGRLWLGRCWRSKGRDECRRHQQNAEDGGTPG